VELAADSPEARRITSAMQVWRQGDVALGEDQFVHLADPVRPLTRAAAHLPPREDGQLPAATELVEGQVDGLVVVTQTCDLLRCCVERPFVEVSPLIVVASDRLSNIKRLHSPRFAFVPALAGRCLVADLDRTMTVEKAVVAAWERTAGCATDEERRRFAEALARKRERFAFPNAFNKFVAPLVERLKKLRGKPSDEGQAIDALLEIRVAAEPAWNAEAVELMFWFVRPEDSELGKLPRDWSAFLETWLGLLSDAQRFVAEGEVVPLSLMSAMDYRRSDRLDLDRLSSGR
jgi:hypothetical protein